MIDMEKTGNRVRLLKKLGNKGEILLEMVLRELLTLVQQIFQIFSKKYLEKKPDLEEIILVLPLANSEDKTYKLKYASHSVRLLPLTQELFL